MQTRQSQFLHDQPRPVCHINPSHTVYGHGSYKRLINYLTAVIAVHMKIRRWLCVPCGRTWSVLPDEQLPYRPTPVDAVEAHFDARANGQPAPAATELEEGCLKRAWHHFTLRLTALAANLGQLMQREDLADAKHFWRGLRRWGNLQEILRVLSADFHTSLFRDYRCIQPWPAS